MSDGILTRLARAAAIPAGGLLSFVHRRTTPEGSVLEVVARGHDTAEGAQRWLGRLRRVAMDPRIRCVLMSLRASPGGWSTAGDLRSVLQEIRAAGKQVWVILDSPGNSLMWIASAADKIIVPPVADVPLVGVGIELTFLGGGLARLGLEADIEAAGEYKSFGERFTRTHASAENREAMESLVDSLQQRLETDLAAARNIPLADLRALMEEAPFPAARALEAGLVDVLAYPDELGDMLEEAFGGDVPRVSFESWAGRDGTAAWIAGWGRRRSIAVVYLEGGIVMEDDSSRVAVRARSTVELLDSLRKDDDVAGVVLHVNSPGGGAYASDLMWRAVKRLGEDKPVVAAFGDTAASGGYYLSAAAREIMARSLSLTGSIGVVGGKMVAGDAMRSLGVVSQTFAATSSATAFTSSRRFNKAERKRFRESLQRIYDGFVERVAEGRGVEVEAVEPHCRGRVWTGTAARERGLVDREGNTFDAVDRVAELASLPRGTWRRVDMSPAMPKPFAALIRSMVMRRLPVGARVLADTVDAGTALLQSSPGEALAVLPWSIKIR